jgi:hypothetical protein
MLNKKFRCKLACILKFGVPSTLPGSSYLLKPAQIETCAVNKHQLSCVDCTLDYLLDYFRKSSSFSNWEKLTSTVNNACAYRSLHITLCSDDVVYAVQRDFSVVEQGPLLKRKKSLGFRYFPFAVQDVKVVGF